MGPEDDLLIPPLNFAMVDKGVYRSGYPNKKNLPFLYKLRLRSVVYVLLHQLRVLIRVRGCWNCGGAMSG